MSNLHYEENHWGDATFDIMTTGIHEYHKWMSGTDTFELTVEPTEEMIRFLNALCRRGGDRWDFIDTPDHQYQWQACEDAKKGIPVKMRFEMHKSLVPMFKLAWHGR